MNKLITKLTLALCRDVDGVVSFFDAYTERLNKLSAHLKAKAAKKRERASRLSGEAEGHVSEADRATRVAQRVSDLMR